MALIEQGVGRIARYSYRMSFCLLVSRCIEISLTVYSSRAEKGCERCSRKVGSVSRIFCSIVS